MAFPDRELSVARSGCVATGAYELSKPHSVAGSCGWTANVDLRTFLLLSAGGVLRATDGSRAGEKENEKGRSCGRPCEFVFAVSATPLCGAAEDQRGSPRCGNYRLGIPGKVGALPAPVPCCSLSISS